jgi:predicted DNA-binding transcriptional regulator AlpA
MKRSDLIPLKRVADELGVSRATLWRARQSHLPDFPEPMIVRRLVYWRRGDLGRLENALMLYQGRVRFEQRRDAQRKIDQLKVEASPERKRTRRRPKQKAAQPDLFERRS